MEISVHDDPVGFVRRNIQMFFPNGPPSAMECATRLVEDALTLGASTVRISVESGFWTVCANENWLFHEELDVSALFRRLVPLPEAGPNSFRSEVFLGAFAETIEVLVPERGWTNIRGLLPTSVRESATSRGWRAAIAFSFSAVAQLQADHD